MSGTTVWGALLPSLRSIMMQVTKSIKKSRMHIEERRRKKEERRKKRRRGERGGGEKRRGRGGEEEEEVVVVVVVIIIIIAVTHMKKYKQTRGGFGILFPSNETLYSQKWEEDGRERNYTLSHATCL